VTFSFSLLIDPPSYSRTLGQASGV
jgi:hypothetical protein